MNADPSGPFYKGLKMLGRKEDPREFLTQGSFVKYLVRLITRRPDIEALELKKGDPVETDPRGIPVARIAHELEPVILTVLH